MKKIYLFITAFALIFSSGCKKYLDVNVDPATPQDVDIKNLTAPLFAQMHRGVAFDARWLGCVIQNWGYRTTGFVGDIHGWTTASDNMGEIWRTNYYGLGPNLNLIDAGATQGQEYNYLGVSQALRAWSWQITTDYHGEIILKQAYEPNRYVFDYDAQPLVYAEVLRLVEESNKNLTRADSKGTVARLALGDPIYKGDATKWVKFNYGTLARNLNNQINKSTYDADKVIEAVDKSFTSNADNFLIPLGGTAGANTTNGNFFGPLRGNLNSYRQSRFMVGLLNGAFFTGTAGTVIDPRITTLLTPSNDGQYRGTQPGVGDPATTAATLPTAIPNPWGSIGLSGDTPTPGAGNGRYLFRDNSSFPVMTYSELQFIKAEAAFRKGDLPTAHTAYLNGISSNIDFVSALGAVTTPSTAISAAAKTAYLTSAAVRQTPGTLTLKDIMLQKYIAMYGHAFVETWSDLRKYHYVTGDSKGNNPYAGSFTLPLTFFGDNGGKPIQRYRPRYNSEYLWNIASLRTIGGDKADYHTFPVWFSEP